MFSTSTYCQDFLRTCCNKRLFHRLNESQPSATHPSASRAPTFALSLGFYPCHIHLVLLMPQPPHPDTLGSQSPQRCRQVPSSEDLCGGASWQLRSRPVALLALSSSPKHPDLVQLSCCALHHHFYASIIKDPCGSKSGGLQRWPLAIPQDTHVKVALAAHHQLYGDRGACLVSYILQ